MFVCVVKKELENKVSIWSRNMEHLFIQKHASLIINWSLYYYSAVLRWAIWSS